MRRMVVLSAVVLALLAGCGKPKTALGTVASVVTAPELTSVWNQMPDQKWPPEGSYVEQKAKPRDGNAWLVVVFEQEKGELSFDTRQYQLAVEGEAAPVPCWGASANGGKQFILDSLTRPAQTAEVQGMRLRPALAFEVPAAAHAGTLTVAKTQVPLRW